MTEQAARPSLDGRIRTVEELRDALARARRRADGVGRFGDPGLSTAEGDSAVRVLPDGTAEVITFGRGEADDVVDSFPSEQAAIQELARVLLQAAPPARTRAEDRASARRMQRVARAVLVRLRSYSGPSA